MVVKSFRGLLADGGQDQIRLSTNNGKTGYQIIKFQLMGPNADTTIESVLKIYKSSQTSIDTAIDFSDGNLLAAAAINETNDPHYQPAPVVIFDNQIINQDIFITAKGTYAVAINYYIELEVTPLTDQGAEYTTLKDLRTQQTS